MARAVTSVLRQVFLPRDHNTRADGDTGKPVDLQLNLAGTKGSGKGPVYIGRSEKTMGQPGIHDMLRILVKN